MNSKVSRKSDVQSAVRAAGEGREGGFVLIVVAVLLIVLIGFVALGVDTGALYSARTSAQRIADAAALAGAGTFITDPLAVDHDATAILHATAVAETGTIMGTPVTAGDVTVVSDWANRRVTVTLNSSQKTYFAKVLWTGNVPVAVTAIAEASQNSSGATGNVKPFFVPNTMFAPAGEDACTVCTNIANGATGANAHVLINNDADNTVNQPFVSTLLDQDFVLKNGTPGQAIGPGIFAELQFPGDSNSGAVYRANIEGTNNPEIDCQQDYSVLTGGKTGPTKQGVNTLIGSPNQDQYQGAGAYFDPTTGVTHDISNSLVLLPVWDVCGISGFCPSGKIGTGTNVNVHVIGFALAFITGMSGKDISGHLINATTCGGVTAGGGGGGSSDAGSTVLSIPLRLVRVPTP